MRGYAESIGRHFENLFAAIMQGAPTHCWAKLRKGEDGAVESWHPLAAHSADVAAVTESLLTTTILRKRLANLAGWVDLSEVHVARLCVLASIHDAGKANQGFQRQAFGVSARSHGHVGPIIDTLSADEKWQEILLMPLRIHEMMEWFDSDEVFKQMLIATWAHHGKPVLPSGEFRAELWRTVDERDPSEELKRLGDYARSWYPDAFESSVQPFPDKSQFHHAFNGVLTLADWIGSDDKKFFLYANSLDDPMPISREQASAASSQLFLDAGAVRIELGTHEIGFEGILDPPASTPYPIQQACHDLPLHENGSLTVLESDTGSGKTEAALARFVRLFQAGLVDGMYFAVPTRSAAKQLHSRVKSTVERVFPESQRPPVVQAVPGYLKVDDVTGTRLPAFEVLWNDDDSPTTRGWAAEHPKRYLAGPIVVGTVDQVLLSTLQVKHAHMRAAALLRHFLVVDEVHASDVYMTELMNKVLEHHLAAGGHALLMSATLGSSARIRLAIKGRAIPTVEEAEKTQYPLLTHVDSSRRAVSEIHAASSGNNKDVTTDLRGIAGNAASVAKLAADAAYAGARVLVIRNLVKDCMDTQLAVEEELGHGSDLLLRVGTIPAPHHSRFAPEDRERLDSAVETEFGRSRLSDRGIVAVCTQTVEQSLDIDADLLITDLCPIDVLLQRIGRLHRHNRERPAGFEKAKCVVITPSERSLGEAIYRDGSARKGKHGLGTVYQDLRMLEAAWRVLENSDAGDWNIPHNNRFLVERGTHPDILGELVDGLGGAWIRHANWIVGGYFADRQHSAFVSVDRDKPFGCIPNLFPEDAGKIRTRLGNDDYRVEFSDGVVGPFGAPFHVLPISMHQVRGESPEVMDAGDIYVGNGTVGFRFAGFRYKYSRLGVSIDSTSR